MSQDIAVKPVDYKGGELSNLTKVTGAQILLARSFHHITGTVFFHNTWAGHRFLPIFYKIVYIKKYVFWNS